MKSVVMEINETLREQIFEIIDTQIRKNDPFETRITFDRLLKQGYDDFHTKQLIGQCLAVELFGVLKHGKPYDNERYVRNLTALPNKPSE